MLRSSRVALSPESGNVIMFVTIIQILTGNTAYKWIICRRVEERGGGKDGGREGGTQESGRL